MRNEMDSQVEILRKAIALLDEFRIFAPPDIGEELLMGRATAMVEVVDAGNALRRAVKILDGEI